MSVDLGRSSVEPEAGPLSQRSSFAGLPRHTVRSMIVATVTSGSAEFAGNVGSPPCIRAEASNEGAHFLFAMLNAVPHSVRNITAIICKSMSRCRPFSPALVDKDNTCIMQLGQV